MYIQNRDMDRIFPIKSFNLLLQKRKGFYFSPICLETILLSVANTAIYWTNQNFTHESEKKPQHNTNLFNLRKCSCKPTAFKEKCWIRAYLQNLYGEPRCSTMSLLPLRADIWNLSVFLPSFLHTLPGSLQRTMKQSCSILIMLYWRILLS